MMRQVVAAAILVMTAMPTRAQEVDAPAPPSSSAMHRPAAAPLVVDNRPEAENAAHFKSVWGGNCGYGVLSIGDNGIKHAPVTSNAVAHLKAMLTTLTVDGSHRIELNSYRIILNGHERAEQQNANMPLGLVGALIASAMSHSSNRDHCTAENMPYGWYDNAETTNDKSPIVLETRLAVDQQDRFVRSVFSPSREYYGGVRVNGHRPEDVAEFEQAVMGHNTKVISAIEQQLGFPRTALPVAAQTVASALVARPVAAVAGAAVTVAVRLIPAVAVAPAGASPAAPYDEHDLPLNSAYTPPPSEMFIRTLPPRP